MPTAPDYPLRFVPILKQRMWGGSRLGTVLGRPLPQGVNIGESWEISDCGSDISIVANGKLKGRSLRELMEGHGAELLGRCRPWSRFPLLVKWLDARQKLSVQVHPPDGHPRLPPGELGKTECWYVLEADEGAEIFLGLQPGVDRTVLQRELAAGTAGQCLNRYLARPGDFFFIPAGTVHALGGGIIVAEIQQASDTTFRLFDWNRTDPSTGRPRQLQVEAALDSIDFRPWSGGPVRLGNARNSDRQLDLIAADSSWPFALRWDRIGGAKPLGQADRFHLIVCLGGEGKLHGGDEPVAVRLGDCLLLPACGPLPIEPSSATLELLDAWIP